MGRICRNILCGACAIAIFAMVSGCSATKHVPAGSLLLDNVHIDIEGDSLEDFDAEEMRLYLRQQPNHKIFWSMKSQLGVYNLSGSDTTKWYNRWFRNMGEAPVIFSRELTDLSQKQLRTAMINKGYLEAEVEVDSFPNYNKKRTDVTYTLRPGKPHVVRTIDWTFPDDSIASIVTSASSGSLLKPGVALDRTLLDAERERIVRVLRNRGYYAFTKEFISFNADTTAGSYDVDLALRVSRAHPPRSGGVRLDTHAPYFLRSIKVITNYDPATMFDLTQVHPVDSVSMPNLTIYYGGDRYLKPGIIAENCYLTQGETYTTRDVNATYQAFGRLEIINFFNIQFIPAGVVDGKEWLDAYLLLTPGKSQSIALDLEGTNSEGDLGVAAGITYSHRNIGHGSETLTTKIRGAYESISGNLDGFIHDRYMEYSADVSLSYPKFKFPFLSESFKRRLQASTEFKVSMNYQERPEYTRIISTAEWSYKWTDPRGRKSHRFSPLEINYVYLPKSTESFLDDIAPDNPLLRYSYEDHFIMSMAYRFYYTTKRRGISLWGERFQANVSTVRVSAETSGNLLYGINNIFSHRSNVNENPYKVFGIRYSQYVKGEVEYSFTHNFDLRNTLAFRAGIGIAYPYGNSRILPFEKRFYGGGANGVRGWDVRTLGPGNYDSRQSVQSFINQCGDINLILSLEYRAKLFWLFEGALFVDAGNIWTVHNYENQPGGMFHFKTFAEQIAMSYGVGLRLNFDYFLIRIDMGMKAHNPAKNSEPWPLLHPRWGRDHSFHFSIGYPF